MKLGLRRKRKKSLPSRIQKPLMCLEELSQTWSMVFMSDALSDGHRICVFNVIDDCNRESLAIECDVGFPAERVIRVLTQLEEEIVLPKKIRVDNGPEFISHAFQNWCKSKSIKIQFIHAEKPMQNCFIERFNRFFREDILDAYWFEGLDQLRILAEKRRQDYNHNPPHKSLGRKAQCEYKKRIAQPPIERNNQRKCLI